MKARFRIALAAVALTLGPGGTLAAAEQPSIDQLAIESGVVAWVSAWNPGDKPFSLKKLQPLYRANVVTHAADKTLRTWDEYASRLSPCVEQFVELTAKPADELKVHFSDRRAEAAFVIHPTGKRRDGTAVTATSRVRLVWTKEGGLWRIAEQHINCTKDSDTSTVAAR